jgi:hypothetical protein
MYTFCTLLQTRIFQYHGDSDHDSVHVHVFILACVEYYLTGIMGSTCVNLTRESQFASYLYRLKEVRQYIQTITECTGTPGIVKRTQAPAPLSGRFAKRRLPSRLIYETLYLGRYIRCIDCIAYLLNHF